MLVEPKKYKGQTIYPELLKTTDDVEADLDVVFAIYNKGKLVKSNGDFNFLSHLPIAKLKRQEFTVINEGDYREFWYQADSNKLVVIVEKETFFVSAMQSRGLTLDKKWVKPMSDRKLLKNDIHFKLQFYK